MFFMKYPVYDLIKTNFLYCTVLLQQVRIMKGKDSGDNKGFAFVTFRNMEMASDAIDELNNTEFKVA